MKKIKVCEMWYKDIKENYKEICEQSEYENLLIIARLYPIEVYETGRKKIEEYTKYFNKFFNFRSRKNNIGNQSR